MAPDVKSTTDGDKQAAHPPTDLASGAKCPFASASNGHKISVSAPASTSNGDGFVDGGWAACLHDNINLVVLNIMAFAAAYSMWKMDYWAQVALTRFAAGYMVLDAIWISQYPGGVKSPKTVLGHHVATLLVLLDPLAQPQHSFYTSCALLVEFNTLLLILRRKLSWGQHLEIPFALTWVALRLIWYPFLGFYMTMCAFPKTLAPLYPERLVSWRISIEGDRAAPMFLVSFLAWVGICLFQGWWSCALVRSYSRPATPNKKYL